MNENPIKTVIVEDMVSYIDTIEMLLQEILISYFGTCAIGRIKRIS